MKNEFLEKDVTQLALLYGKFNYNFSKTKTIQLKTIEKNLKEKHGLTFKEFIEQTTGKKLIYKMDITDQKEQEFQMFLEKVKKINPLFIEILPTKTLIQYKEKNDLESFVFVDKILNALPKQPTYLPYFANQLTGNPHALDNNQPMNSLLQTMLKAQTRLTESEIYQAPTEQEHEIFNKNNLIRDDIMNNVAFQNLYAIRNNTIVWKEFCYQHTIWLAPTKEIDLVSSIIPANNQEFVIVLENSSVFSYITEQFPELPIICSAGQANYAVWLLLRRLPEHIKIYYSGDLDINGLIIANNFYQAFTERIQFLATNTQILKQYGEPQKQTFDSTQVNKLNKLIHEDLKQIGSMLIEHNLKAMQENYTDLIIKEINQIERRSNL